MSANWTPGPWVVETEAEPGGDDPEVYVCHAGTVCDCTTVCNLQPSAVASVKQRQANASLIAAAPYLYAALQSTRKRLYDAMIALGSSPEFADAGC